MSGEPDTAHVKEVRDRMKKMASESLRAEVCEAAAVVLNMGKRRNRTTPQVIAPTRGGSKTPRFPRLAVGDKLKMCGLVKSAIFACRKSGQKVAGGKWARRAVEEVKYPESLDKRALLTRFELARVAKWGITKNKAGAGFDRELQCSFWGNCGQLQAL